MQIKVENLKYAYAKHSSIENQALKGVNLTVNEGDFFGIIGKTGSGKSTFVQHLNGLIKLQKNSGSIKIGEFNLNDKKCDYKKLRSKVGMVFQYPEYQLFGETILSDVAFGLKNFEKNISEFEIERRVKDALTQVGLDYDRIKDKSPFEVSGGQKRRIAIAGVIVSRPEILILDEPAAGLDPKGKREFIATLKNLQKEFVKTIVIVSHDMDLVAENCNRVALFEDGKVAKVGTPKEIFLDENLNLPGLPITAYATKKLKENGIDIDSDLTVKDFTLKVNSQLGGKR